MPTGSHSAETILLVDDQDLVLRSMRGILELNDYNVMTTTSGETALEIAASEEPDLILLDINMPMMDGYEVCRKLKENPATESTPVIFLSGEADTSDLVTGLELGAVDYITKPAHAEEVVARVRTHLTIRRLQREVEVQKRDLEHELRVTSEVQCRLLPTELPQIEGLRLGIHYETSRYAGGDYYDFVEIDQEMWGFLIADAMGHGAPAAVLMAITCALFRTYSGDYSDPAQVIHSLNEHLLELGDGNLVSAVYAVYDGRDRSFRFVRAGHTPPIFSRPSSGSCDELADPGVRILGVRSFSSIPVIELTLAPEDRFMIYTDGISERMNATDEMFGSDRLTKIMAQAELDSPQAICRQIIGDVQDFSKGRPPEDDQTLFIGVVRKHSRECLREA